MRLVSKNASRRNNSYYVTLHSVPAPGTNACLCACPCEDVMSCGLKAGAWTHSHMTAHTCWQTNTHSVRDQCSGKSGKRSSKEEQPCSWFRRHRYCCLSLLAMTQPAAISPHNVMFDCICSCFKLPWQQRVDRLPVWVASGRPGRPHRPLNQLTRAERSHRVCNLAHSGGVFVAPSDWLRLGGIVQR